MPMYEYKCQECGLVFEARQKFSDAPLSECRECGGRVEKLISQAAFSLKGAAGMTRATGKSLPVAQLTRARLVPAARKQRTNNSCKPQMQYVQPRMSGAFLFQPRNAERKSAKI